MEELMKRMKNPSQICKMQSSIPMEGYLYCQEKCACTGGLDGFLKCNPSSDRLFPWQQGLWECHGSSITADITRRGGSCWWCHVSRRTPLSRWRNLQLLQRIYISVQSGFFYFPSFFFFFLSAISSFCSCYCHSYCCSATGPHAAHAQVLHPTEVGLHRQTLLLWRGD